MKLSRLFSAMCRFIGNELVGGELVPVCRNWSAGSTILLLRQPAHFRIMSTVQPISLFKIITQMVSLELSLSRTQEWQSSSRKICTNLVSNRDGHARPLDLVTSPLEFVVLFPVSSVSL